MSSATGAWPKVPPTLSPEQEEAREAFVSVWHEVLPTNYQFIEKFNHGAVADLPAQPARLRTLEVGAGLGGHLPFEDLSRQEYYCLEYRHEFCERLRRLPSLKAVDEGDIQQRTPYETGFFDRVVAIHVLEHLRDLPRAIDEIDRVLAPGGIFDVVLPCEGSVAYWLARKLSAERLFHKRFKMPYGPIIANEHVNTIFEILPLLMPRFTAVRKRYFPLPVRSVYPNLVIALRLIKTAPGR
jgi:SAM-dependent methyltransferase